MTTDNLPSVLESGAALPAHLQQYADKDNEAGGLATSALSFPQISIRGKQFRFVKDGVETPWPMGHALRVVILGFDPPEGCAKSFYAGAYKPDSKEGPDCASADGIKPDPFYTAPVSRSCAECPHNAWGSGVDSAGTPTAGKRCGDHKNLFVVAADTLDGDIAVLRVPATSLKALSGFAAELKRHNAPMQGLIVELSFTDAESPQLNFKGVQWLDAEPAKKMIDRGKSDELTEMKPTNTRGPAREAPALLAPPPDDMPAPPPGIPAAEPVKTMTDKANGVSYDDYVKKGWTDDLLVTHGYLIISSGEK